MTKTRCLGLVLITLLGCCLCTTPVAYKLLDNIIEYRNLPVESTSTSLFFDGRNRTYNVYVPQSLSQFESVALVLVLHGGGGTGEGMEKLTLSRFHDLAERDGFIVVYPDGVENHWNDGRELQDTAFRENIDDVGFIAALIDELSTQYPIDTRRVYATGISNGGMMSYRLACELSERIAAIAPVVASISPAVAADCTPSRLIPVLIMNGTDDPLVKIEGGERDVLGRSIGRILSLDENVALWMEHNGCQPPPTIQMLPDTDRDDGTRVRLESYAGCAAGGALEVYVIEGGGHTWPDGFQYFDEWLIGRTSHDVDASAIIWSFFGQYTLPAPPPAS